MSQRYEPYKRPTRSGTTGSPAKSQGPSKSTQKAPSVSSTSPVQSITPASSTVRLRGTTTSRNKSKGATPISKKVTRGKKKSNKKPKSPPPLSPPSITADDLTQFKPVKDLGEDGNNGNGDGNSSQNENDNDEGDVNNDDRFNGSEDDGKDDGGEYNCEEEEDEVYEEDEGEEEDDHLPPSLEPPAPRSQQSRGSASRNQQSRSARPPHEESKPIGEFRLTGMDLQCFNCVASRANLDEESKAMGRLLCNVEGTSAQFFTCMASILAGRQETRLLCEEMNHRFDILQGTTQSHKTSKKLEWTAPPELRGCIRLLASRLVLDGDVQAYTAKQNRHGNKDNLPLSLYAKVLRDVLSKNEKWKRRVLPPGYSSDPDPAAAASLRKVINAVLKDIRKESLDIILTNIRLPNQANPLATNANVPRTKSMIAKLYEKSKSLVVGPICVREDVIANVKHLQEARFAWLRLQAIHWGIHGDQYLGQTFWNVVDSKLEELRGKSLRYRYAYHVCILHDDFDLINGKATFKQIQSNKGNKFLMPSDARVLTCVQELNDTFGDDGPQDEAEHESIAVAVDEEEGNEEEDEGEQQED